MSALRILQVYQIFNPNVASGVAKVAYDISKTLAKKGHKVVFYASDMKDRFTRYNENNYTEVDGIEVYRFRTICTFLSREFRIYVTPSLIISGNRIRKFDVIHLHGYISFQNIVVSYYAKRYKIPYILQAHGSLPVFNGKPKDWQRLKKIYNKFFGLKMLKNASKCIALNEMEAEHYRSMGVPKEKIAIIPNGIDLSEYAELPPKGSFKKKFNIPIDKKIILYLGRIHKTKGIDLLVRAYVYLINEMHFKDAILVVAGPDDGYLNEVKALARSLGVCNSIVFTGFISSEDKLKALVDADVFVTPSFYGFPMTFLEACAVGTPIVTTSLGDTLEWIDGKVGYVAQPTHHDLAEAIYRIVSDDKLRKKFSRNCIEVVRSDFSIEKVVERLERVYREVVES